MNLAAHWLHDPAIDFLNHGSFGSMPRAVFEAQQRYQLAFAAEPVRFLTRERPALIDRSRRRLAVFIGADPRDLVFVRNATEAVNAVVRSLPFGPGDELLTTNHAYGACDNALRYAAERAEAKVVTAQFPFPIHSPQQVIDAVLAAVSPRTKLVMLDHVTSPTGIILPVAPIVAELNKRGIDSLIDGAHAPGMIPLNLDQLGATYYTGNCHKWLCTPIGAALLHVRRDRQHAIRPAVISHNATVPLPGESRFHAEFDWPGTIDFSPWFAVADAIDFLESLLPGGIPSLMAHNHNLALCGREILCHALSVPAPCPPEMIGSIAAVPLPDETRALAYAMDTTTQPTPSHDLHTRLLNNHRIEVPTYFWPKYPHRLIRIAAQAYNSEAQYERLAVALTKELAIKSS